MSYFPKSKIQENQYTKGGEYQRKDTGEQYVGIYCILSDGRYFSESTLLKSSIELLKIDKNAKKTPYNVFPINQLSNKFSFLNQQKELVPHIPQPTSHDYNVGFMKRYFAKKLISEVIQIFEISQQSYDEINSNKGNYLSLYQTISLDWKITGPKYDMYDNPLNPTYGVMDTNKRTIEIKEKEMKGIQQYFNGRLNEFAK